MASAPQGFQRRVKDRVAPERVADLNFFLETTDEDEEGNEFVVRRDDFTAKAPSEEQLLVLFAEAGRENSTMADEAGAMFDLFRAVLPAAQYKVLMRRFKDPDDVDVDFETLQDILNWMMEQWQSFPTKSPSDSSSSQGTSGARSTGRARGKGSTR